MVGKGNEKAPAAVAGVQIDYDIFREMFFNETNKVKRIFFIKSYLRSPTFYERICGYILAPKKAQT